MSNQTEMLAVFEAPGTVSSTFVSVWSKTPFGSMASTPYFRWIWPWGSVLSPVALKPANRRSLGLNGPGGRAGPSELWRNSKSASLSSPLTRTAVGGEAGTPASAGGAVAATGPVSVEGGNAVAPTFGAAPWITYAPQSAAAIMPTQTRASGTRHSLPPPFSMTYVPAK